MVGLSSPCLTSLPKRETPLNSPGVKEAPSIVKPPLTAPNVVAVVSTIRRKCVNFGSASTVIQAESSPPASLFLAAPVPGVRDGSTEDSSNVEMDDGIEGFGETSGRLIAVDAGEAVPVSRTNNSLACFSSTRRAALAFARAFSSTTGSSFSFSFSFPFFFSGDFLSATSFASFTFHSAIRDSAIAERTVGVRISSRECRQFVRESYR